MSYLQKIKDSEKKSSHRLAWILGIVLLVGVIIFAITPPELDENFCPKNRSKIQKHHLSMLIDISDQLTNNNKKIVNEIIMDWTDSATSSQKLSVYSLNTNDINQFEDVDTICSPPNVNLLAFTDGRQKANIRIQKFKDRLLQTIQSSAKSNSQINDSRILESIRQITNSPNWFSKSSRLILISDLIEKSKFADFYSGNVPDFSDWIKSDTNKGLASSINMSRGDKVQICQLLTDRPGYAARQKALSFWIELFRYKGVDEVVESCNGVVGK